MPCFVPQMCHISLQSDFERKISQVQLILRQNSTKYGHFEAKIAPKSLKIAVFKHVPQSSITFQSFYGTSDCGTKFTV